MLNIDFKKTSQFFSDNDLWEKPFKKFDKMEIVQLCETIMESVDKKDGWESPYLNNDGIVIPFNAPLKYRWWQGGQSLLDTLEEIGAPESILEKYNHPKK